MACRCSPSLVRLMADFAKLGHVNSGCCGDAAHQARKSDHNADASGYAHAQDIHEKSDHDMQPFVDFIMANPALFPQIKYLIYEGHIYYPHNGARRAGKYVYTGPNSHAHHLHVSINSDATNYGGSWHVAEAYGARPAPTPPPVPPHEEDDMQPILGVQRSDGTGFVLIMPNVGTHPVLKIPLTAWDTLPAGPQDDAGGVDDALRQGLMVYLNAQDEVINAIPTAGG